MDTENAAFWLPSHFLTDDDFLPVADDHLPPRNFDLFSDGFDPFAPLSALQLDFPLSSPGTDKDKDNNDIIENNDNNNNYYDEELLSVLTRQLAHSTLHNLPEKSWALSTSPQSTLSGFGPLSGFSSNGSPNGPSQEPSPPLTPPGAKNDAAWELLRQAATQVARLKVNALAAQLSQHQNRAFINATRHHINTFYDYPNTNQQVKRQGSGMWGQGRKEREEWYFQQNPPRRSCGVPHSAWPSPRPHHHLNQRQLSDVRGGPTSRPVFLCGSGSVPAVKKPSTGTGVFIPRRFGAQPETRKKPTDCPNVTIPAGMVQALNFNPPSRLGTGFGTNHGAEILLARRNALLSQQRSSLRPEMPPTMVGHDVRLPSDWTY